MYNMYFAKVNSLRLIPLNSNSNDCIKEYNYFYRLVDKYYPGKTNSQKVYMALYLCKIRSYERITKQKFPLIKVEKNKLKNWSCFKIFKKYFHVEF